VIDYTFEHIRLAESAVQTRMRCVLFLGVATLSATAIAAQQITGRVTVRGDGSAVQGAVATVETRAGRIVASVLTDSAGRFLIRRADSAAVLRIRRIGFRPFERRLLDSIATGSVTFAVEMERAPAVLDPIVSTDTRCAQSRTMATARAYWEQARVALLATDVARIGAEYDVLSYDRRIQGDAEIEHVEPMSKRERERRGIRSLDTRVTFDPGYERYPPPPGTATQFVTRFDRRTAAQPWISARAPEDFAREGYFRATQGKWELFAPDAGVLRDSSFAETHCVQVASNNDAHRGQIGIAFAPTLGRDTMPEIIGTLWIDRSPLKLRSVDFTYVGPGAAPKGRSGGRLIFGEGSSGIVVLESWAIWYPERRPMKHSVSYGIDTSMSDTLIIATTESHDPWIHEVGALLLEARWPDGGVLKRPLPGIVGQVVDSVSKKPRPGVSVSVPGGGRRQITDAQGRFQFDTLIAGAYNVTVLDTAMIPFGIGRGALPFVATADTAPHPLTTIRMSSAYAAVRRKCFSSRGADGIVAIRIVDTLSRPVDATLRVFAPVGIVRQGMSTLRTENGSALACPVGKGTVVIEASAPSGAVGRVARETSGKAVLDTVTVVIRQPPK
jgi:hypothetical protein